MKALITTTSMAALLGAHGPAGSRPGRRHPVPPGCRDRQSEQLHQVRFDPVARPHAHSDGRQGDAEVGWWRQRDAEADRTDGLQVDRATGRHDACHRRRRLEVSEDPDDHRDQPRLPLGSHRAVRRPGESGTEERSMSDAQPDMVRIPGGTFRMGSDRHYPEEAPVHTVTVGAFQIDATPVTNAEFRAFVQATGYVTWAEIAPAAKDYPGARPEMLKAGGLVSPPPAGPVALADWSQWWRFTFGVNWRRPHGKGSHIGGVAEHPVVQVAFRDAEAYAKWAGKELPTEAEWEFAPRGGLDGAEFAWGDELTPGGRHMANTWQGRFPVENTREDGFARTSPVRAFPPNGYGVHDMIGNV